MMLAALEHPADQTFQVAIRQRASILLNLTFRDRGAEQRAPLATEFVLERLDEFREARAKPGDADGTNGFLPGILIIRRHGKNLFEQHLRREAGAARRELRATITAQNAATDDRSGQRGTGDTREERRLFVVKKRNSGKRRTQHYAGIQTDAFNKGFVFTNDAEAGEGGDYIEAGFAWRLAHIGNNGFIGLKGDAFLQLPAQHRLGFGGRAREFFEVLHENANNGIRKDQGNVFIMRTQALADAGDRGPDSGAIHDVGFDS